MLEAAMGPVVLVREDTPLRDVATLMLERQVDSVVVVDGTGAVRGMVTDRDLTMAASELMDRRITTAELVEPLGRVVDRMLRRDAESALVQVGGTVIGTLGRRELLRLIAGQPNTSPCCRTGTA